MKSFYFIWAAIIFVSACAQLETRTAHLSKDSFLAIHQSPEERKRYEATGSQYMITSQGVATTQAAARIFEEGGNIIDAAVAASFTVSVERPHSTGIGGGGFLIYREAKTGKIYAIDFRERAPIRASEKMFLDAKGEVVPGLSTDGVLAAGVPGLIKGVLEIHKKFGRLSRKQVMRPAFELAQKGFPVYQALANALEERKEVLARFHSSAQIFLKPNGDAYQVGEILVQKDLAETLSQIAGEGEQAFYQGDIAKKIVKESQAQHGLIGLNDLKRYRVKWREPVRGNYHGYEIISMPPPSSGGTHVVEILNILERDALKDLGYGSVAAIHLEASAMQQAFADRASFMGDPDFLKSIPLKGLLSKGYAKKIREQINAEHARKIGDVSAGSPQKYESSETTNFTIMDSSGNVVISTQTVNGWMGSGLVVSGTGFLLNNEMDDFSAKPGASNLYGAVGSTANAIVAEKTPLSSMAPTLIMKNRKPVMALGAPGGTRIITCVAQTILNHLGFELPLYESVTNLRVHHQWSPDQLDIEKPGFSSRTMDGLESLGYKINLSETICRVNAITFENGLLRGVADPRDLGASFGH